MGIKSFIKKKALWFKPLGKEVEDLDSWYEDEKQELMDRLSADLEAKKKDKDKLEDAYRKEMGFLKSHYASMVDRRFKIEDKEAKAKKFVAARVSKIKKRAEKWGLRKKE